MIYFLLSFSLMYVLEASGGSLPLLTFRPRKIKYTKKCSSGTRRRWTIYCHMTETYDHFVQLDLEIFYQQFFWPALYATPGTPAYMETCFQYKQVNYVSWMTMIHLVVLCLSFLVSIYI